jgi:hypothetical protein
MNGVNNGGFRVASVPEASTGLLVVLGLSGSILKRVRRVPFGPFSLLPFFLGRLSKGKQSSNTPCGGGVTEAES